jgi:hypothetical protein
LAGFAAVEDTEVVHCDLFAVFDVSFCIDSISIDVLVPAFRGIVVTSMINAACINEYARFPYTVPKGKGVRSDDSQAPRGSIVVIKVMHRDEGLLLVWSERTNLFIYGCS